MEEKFGSVSFFGRLAYIIMCVERFLVSLYPDRDWTLVSEKMWLGTTTSLDAWNGMFSGVLPDVVMHADYDTEYNDPWAITKEEFLSLKELYTGITEGLEDDPSDPVSYMIFKPFDLTTRYEGTSFGKGEESYEYIEEAESMLQKYGIPLPDHTKVAFSSIKEFYGWGNYFDGRFLSIILHPEQKSDVDAGKDSKESPAHA